MLNTNTTQYVTDSKSISFFKSKINTFLSNLNILALSDEATYENCVTSKIDFDINQANVNILLKQSKYGLLQNYPKRSFHIAQLKNLSSYLEEILSLTSIIILQNLLVDLCTSNTYYIYSLELNINSLYFQASSQLDNSTIVISIEKK
jgi:hypothetical protein